jgi:hypothetical protein
MKFFPSWTYIIAIWWSMAIDPTTNSSKVSFDGTELKM